MCWALLRGQRIWCSSAGTPTGTTQVNCLPGVQECLHHHFQNHYHLQFLFPGHSLSSLIKGGVHFFICSCTMRASIASLSARSKTSSSLGVSFPFCKMRSNRETMHSSGTWIKETSKEVSDAKQSRHSSLNEGGCGKTGKICEVATFM